MLYLGAILLIVSLVGLPVSILILIIRACMKKQLKGVKTALKICLVGVVAGFGLVAVSPEIKDNIDIVDSISQKVGNSADKENDDSNMAELDENDVDGGEFYDIATDGSDGANTGEDIDKVLFDVSEYPYQNEKEAKKLMKTYKKAMEAPITDFIGVEEVSKGGIIKEKEIHYKKTVDAKNAAYRYYGKTNKNGEPEGTGILFETWPMEWQESGNIHTTICYIGGFKDGFKDGFGIEYWEFSGTHMVDYEGGFKKGKYHGEGIDYLYDISDSYASAAEIRDKIYSQTEGNTLRVEPIWLSLKRYEGDFKEGEYDGKGKAYWSVEDDKEILTYEGEFEEGNFHGEGTLYFDNGNVEYKGKFKNGYYNGKGTLYDEQGNVIHKGKFKSGDIE